MVQYRARQQAVGFSSLALADAHDAVPVYQCCLLCFSEATIETAFADDSFQIIGVVKDALNQDLAGQKLPEVYLPYSLLGRADRLVVLTRNDPASGTKAVLSQVYAIDKNQPVTNLKTIDRVLQEEVYVAPRFNFALFSVFVFWD